MGLDRRLPLGALMQLVSLTTDLLNENLPLSKTW